MVYFIIFTSNSDFSFSVWTKDNEIKINILFKRPDLSIAIHNLNMWSENWSHFFILLDIVKRLMVYCWVHYWFSCEKSSINKEIDKECTCHNKELISSDGIHHRNLLPTSLFNINLNFFWSLVFKSNLLIHNLKFFISLLVSIEQVSIEI